MTTPMISSVEQLIEATSSYFAATSNEMRHTIEQSLHAFQKSRPAWSICLNLLQRTFGFASPPISPPPSDQVLYLAASTLSSKAAAAMSTAAPNEANSLIVSALTLLGSPDVITKRPLAKLLAKTAAVAAVHSDFHGTGLALVHRCAGDLHSKPSTAIAIALLDVLLVFAEAIVSPSVLVESARRTRIAVAAMGALGDIASVARGAFLAYDDVAVRAAAISTVVAWMKIDADAAADIASTALPVATAQRCFVPMHAPLLSESIRLGEIGLRGVLVGVSRSVPRQLRASAMGDPIAAARTHPALSLLFDIPILDPNSDDPHGSAGAEWDGSAHQQQQSESSLLRARGEALTRIDAGRVPDSDRASAAGAVGRGGRRGTVRLPAPSAFVASCIIPTLSAPRHDDVTNAAFDFVEAALGLAAQHGLAVAAALLPMMEPTVAYAHTVAQHAATRALASDVQLAVRVAALLGDAAVSYVPTLLHAPPTALTALGGVYTRSAPQLVADFLSTTAALLRAVDAEVAHAALDVHFHLLTHYMNAFGDDCGSSGSSDGPLEPPAPLDEADDPFTSAHAQAHDLGPRGTSLGDDGDMWGGALGAGGGGGPKAAACDDDATLELSRTDAPDSATCDPRSPMIARCAPGGSAGHLGRVLRPESPSEAESRLIGSLQPVVRTLVGAIANRAKWPLGAAAGAPPAPGVAVTALPGDELEALGKFRLSAVVAVRESVRVCDASSLVLDLCSQLADVCSDPTIHTDPAGVLAARWPEVEVILFTLSHVISRVRADTEDVAKTVLRMLPSWILPAGLGGMLLRAQIAACVLASCGLVARDRGQVESLCCMLLTMLQKDFAACPQAPCGITRAALDSAACPGVVAPPGYATSAASTVSLDVEAQTVIALAVQFVVTEAARAATVVPFWPPSAHVGNICEALRGKTVVPTRSAAVPIRVMAAIASNEPIGLELSECDALLQQHGGCVPFSILAGPVLLAAASEPALAEPAQHALLDAALGVVATAPLSAVQAGLQVVVSHLAAKVEASLQRYAALCGTPVPPPDASLDNTDWSRYTLRPLQATDADALAKPFARMLLSLASFRHTDGPCPPMLRHWSIGVLSTIWPTVERWLLWARDIPSFAAAAADDVPAIFAAAGPAQSRALAQRVLTFATRALRRPHLPALVCACATAMSGSADVETLTVVATALEAAIGTYTGPPAWVGADNDAYMFALLVCMAFRPVEFAVSILANDAAVPWLSRAVELVGTLMRTCDLDVPAGAVGALAPQLACVVVDAARLAQALAHIAAGFADARAYVPPDLAGVCMSRLCGIMAPLAPGLASLIARMVHHGVQQPQLVCLVAPALRLLMLPPIAPHLEDTLALTRPCAGRSLLTVGAVADAIAALPRAGGVGALPEADMQTLCVRLSQADSDRAVAEALMDALSTAKRLAAAEAHGEL